MIKKDRCKYRFDAHKLIGFSGADYLPDTDEFSMFFLDRLHCLRLEQSVQTFLSHANTTIVQKGCFIIKS